MLISDEYCIVVVWEPSLNSFGIFGSKLGNVDSCIAVLVDLECQHGCVESAANHRQLGLHIPETGTVYVMFV